MNRLGRKRWGVILVAMLMVFAAVFSPAAASAAAVDVIYDGTVNVTPGTSFTVTAYNSGGGTYTVDQATPLGVLQAAGISFDATDKNYATSGALLLDNIKTYNYVKGGSKWYAYVNDVFQDGYNNPAGALNLIALKNGDKVEYYFAAGIEDSNDLNAVKAAATAAVKTVVSTGGAAPATPVTPAAPVTPVTPSGDNTDWTLQLSGVKSASVNKAFFEQGLACPSSGHQVQWTDADGNVWGGVPLWLLVGMVDDDPDVGSDHINFNDELATKNYKIDVIAADGWKATFESSAIARNDGYLVANTLNGQPLPKQTAAGKDSWPLHLKGSAVFGGQQVGHIVRIELSDLPAATGAWSLELMGQVGVNISQEEFENTYANPASADYREWTDKTGNVYSGVPLWVLLGAIDDIQQGNRLTFNEALAKSGYSIDVIAADGFSKTFDIAAVAGSDDYIIANKINGKALTEGAPCGWWGTVLPRPRRMGLLVARR